MTPSPPPLRVKVGAQEVVADGRRQLVLGRADDADVRIDDRLVSRVHAVVRFDAELGWLVEDRSKRGIYRAEDGQAVVRLVVTGPVVLRLADARTGVVVELVPDVGPAPAAPAAPAAGSRPAGGAPPLTVRAGGRTATADGARPFVIGRADDVDLRVPDPLVSRRHAVLVFDPAQGWVLEDQGRRGTYSDGQRITRLPITRPVALRLADPVAGEQVEILTPAPSVSRPGASLDSRRLGQLSSVYRPREGVVRIGRAADNDLVLADLLVSRHHAELRGGPGPGYRIVDLGSHNGTFVDGRRVREAPVDERSVIGIGRHSLRLVDGVLQNFLDAGRITFEALGVSVRLPDGRPLVDEVSFPLAANSLLAVLGPTGCGKSTLVRALAGFQPASAGTVLYDGRDLYRSYEELCRRIGYVPQDDVLHPELRVAEALEYAAELRFPADVSTNERRARVVEVMEELGLAHRAGVSIARLSGGQRKRTSVALELLTKPSLLLLDEPTSGLDPGYERSVMQVLRQLADAGRTVIVVTHSVQSLDLCDRALFLAPGGTIAYFGPPERAVGYFEADGYAQVFQSLDGNGQVDWRDRFQHAGEYADYVYEPLREQQAQAAAAGPAAPPTRATAQRSWVSQLLILVRRYAAVTARDRRNLALLLLQAPIIAGLMAVIMKPNGLRGTAQGASRRADIVLIALVLSATYLGASNAIREIVKELPVYRRERAVGLSASAYIGSKVVVLGLLTVVQAVVLVVVGAVRQGGPSTAAVLGWPKGELLIDVALTGLAGMALGLFISALVSNADKALSWLPVILFAQLLLAGTIFDLAHTPGAREVSYLASANWGFAAAASTVDLGHGLSCPDPRQSEAIKVMARESGDPQLATLANELVPTRRCDPRWQGGAGRWLLDVSALSALTVALLFGAGWALRRRDPLRMTAARL